VVELSCSCSSWLVTLLLSVEADWAEVAGLEAPELGTFCPDAALSFEPKIPATLLATCVASP
jgi:hypothetical protein